MQDFETYQGFKYSSSPKLMRSLSYTPSTESAKMIIIMVGLPARGKSYISLKISNFLSWRGHSCRVFNVGQHRREKMKGGSDQTANFFSGQNQENKRKRDSLALESLEVTIDWLRNQAGQIAIFDATNTTKERRRMITTVIREANYRFLFIESICDEVQTIEDNLRAKAERSPDYKDMPLDQALSDLRKRLANYEKVYEKIEDSEDYGYIKLINLGKKLVCYKLHGYISRLLMVFLINLNIDKKVILLTRAGNSENSNLPKMRKRMETPFKSKESELNAEGLVFAKKLAEFVKNEKFAGLQILVSPLKRALQTAQFINISQVRSGQDYMTDPEGDADEVTILATPLLKMVHQGICYGMKPSVIKESYPEHYHEWNTNPLLYRFPGGESYMDAVERIEPIIIDLEQISFPVLIITHLSIMRIIYGYFKSIPLDKMTDVLFPQGLVLKLKPTLYGWHEERFDLMAGERQSEFEDSQDNVIHNIPVDSDKEVEL